MAAPAGIGRFSLAPYSQSGGTMWAPPEDARPTLSGSAVLIYPEATGVGGDGVPTHYVGLPYAVIRRERATIQGSSSAYAWYWQAESWPYYPVVWAEFFDPRYGNGGAWRVFKAVMHRPKIREVGIAAGVATVSVMEILFTDIEYVP